MDAGGIVLPTTNEKKEPLSHNCSLLLSLVERKEILRKHFFQERLLKLTVFVCL